MFDEPLSNLDAEWRVLMRVEIARLHQRIGATMIPVIHDQTEAMTLASRILVLRAGQIEQARAPQQLHDTPAHAFVAGFIGSPRMNFLSVQAGGGMARFPGGAVPCLAKGAVQIGIRPEHQLIRSAGALCEMRVEMVENPGGTRLAHGVLAQMPEVRRLILAGHDAEALANRHVMGRPCLQPSRQPAARLFLDFPHLVLCPDCRRSQDLATSGHQVSCGVAGTTFHRESFIGDGVLVLRLTAGRERSACRPSGSPNSRGKSRSQGAGSAGRATTALNRASPPPRAWPWGWGFWPRVAR